MVTSTNDRLYMGTIDLRCLDRYGDRLPIANLPIKFFRIDAGSSDVDTYERATERPEKPGKKGSKRVEDLTGEDLSACRTPEEGVTVSDGRYQGLFKPGWWAICTAAFGIERVDKVKVDAGCTTQVCADFDLGISADTLLSNKDGSVTPSRDIRQGQSMLLRVCWNQTLGKDLEITASATAGAISDNSRIFECENQYCREFVYFASGRHGPAEFIWRARSNPHVEGRIEVNVLLDVQNISGETTVSMTRTETEFTEDVAFWTGIRNSTDALSFNTYLRFMDWIFCGGQPPTPGFEAKRFGAKNLEYKDLLTKRFLPFTDSDAYRVVKAATEAFVMVNCGVLQGKDRLLQAFDRVRDNAYLDRRDLPTPPNELSEVFNDEYLVSVNRNGGVLPYVLPYLAVIRKKLPDIPIKSIAFEDAVPGRACRQLLRDIARETRQPLPVGTHLVLLARRRDARANGERHYPALPERTGTHFRGPAVQSGDGSAAPAQQPVLGLHPGRAAPADGGTTPLRVRPPLRPAPGRQGRAEFPTRRHPVEISGSLSPPVASRTVFYKQDDDTTVKADAFPVLNALKEVHLILSQGAHNQFGDLPSTARIEMLMQEWLLARPSSGSSCPPASWSLIRSRGWIGSMP